MRASRLLSLALAAAPLAACSAHVAGGGSDEGLGGAGSGSDEVSASSVESCVAGADRLALCGVAGWQTIYEQYIGSTCDHDPVAQCIAECVAAAPCEALGPMSEELGMLQGCPPSDATGSCAVACMGECSTPLVLSFDRRAVLFAASERAFDLGIGMSVITDWPTAATPWLALDRNGNGAIDDGSELFGSGTPLLRGGRPRDGFIPLRELDSDGDGRLTAADVAWSELLVWSDRDNDRSSSPSELAPLSSFGVVSIDLDYARERRCDSRGNCEVERSRFLYRHPASEVRERHGD